MRNYTSKLMILVFCLLCLFSSVYSMLNVQDFGATGDPQQNATDEIQDAIDSLSGAGTVFFPKGMYQIFDTIEVPSGVTIAGEGWGSVVCTLQKDLTMFKTDDGAEGVQFRDIAIVYDPTCIGGNAFQIEGINSVNMKLFNVKLAAPANRVHAGVRTWDGVDSSDSATDSGRGTQIESCWIIQGLVWLKQSDAKIASNFIWSSETVNILPFAIRIDYKGNSSIIDNDIIPSSGAYGGIYLNHSQGNRIEGNFFDGNSKPSIITKWGVYCEKAYDNSIVGNTFWSLSTGGIYLKDSGSTAIQGNVFLDNNLNDVSTNDDIRIINDTVAGSGVIISGNSHYHRNEASVKTNPAKAVFVGGSMGCDTQVCENAAQGANYAHPVFDNARNSNSSLKNNRVDGYLSKRTGSIVMSKNTNMKFIDFYPPFDVVPDYKEMHVQLERLSTINPPTYMLSGLTNAGVWLVFGQNLSEDINIHWRCEIE